MSFNRRNFIKRLFIGITAVGFPSLVFSQQILDHIILFYQGKILAQGTPEDVMTLEHLAEIYRLNLQVLQKNLHLNRE